MVTKWCHGGGGRALLRRHLAQSHHSVHARTGLTLGWSTLSLRQCPPCSEGQVHRKPPHKVVSIIHVRRDTLSRWERSIASHRSQHWEGLLCGQFGNIPVPCMASSNLFASYVPCCRVILCVMSLCDLSPICLKRIGVHCYCLIVEEV